jgi:hypothetical protein
MLLTLRPTGLASPVHADRQDWTVFEDGRPIDRVNEAQIIAAAAAAGAHKFISRLPRGYHRPSALGVCDMVLEVKDGQGWWPPPRRKEP